MYDNQYIELVHNYYIQQDNVSVEFENAFVTGHMYI